MLKGDSIQIGLHSGTSGGKAIHWENRKGGEEETKKYVTLKPAAGLDKKENSRKTRGQIKIRKKEARRIKTPGSLAISQGKTLEEKRGGKQKSARLQGSAEKG